MEKLIAVPGMNFGGKITGNSFAGEVNGIKTQGWFLWWKCTRNEQAYLQMKQISLGVHLVVLSNNTDKI